MSRLLLGDHYLSNLCKERQLVNLRKQQREKIEEIKKKTNYYSTRTLIERYDEGPTETPLRRRVPTQGAPATPAPAMAPQKAPTPQPPKLVTPQTPAQISSNLQQQLSRTLHCSLIVVSKEGRDCPRC